MQPTIKAVDYSFTKPAIADLNAKGITTVIRYVGPAAWGKCISDAEAAALHKAGLSVVLVFEGEIDDYKTGHDGGVAHARLALENLPKGFPQDRPIYFAVDTAIVPEAAIAYFYGIASVIPATRIGVYGEGALCQMLHDHHMAYWFWQSASTSFPGNAGPLPISHMIQLVAAPVGGTDGDVLLKTDVGQWPAPAHSPAPQPPKPITPPPINHPVGHGYPTLEKGSTDKEAVEELQHLLVKQHLPVGTKGVDGVFGPITETSLVAFQKRSNLRATGVVDAPTWKALLK